MTKLLEHSDLVPKYLHGQGVEIGAFTTPVPGITPIHFDRFGHYAGQPTLAEYLGDACALPVFDSSVDHVVTSHVLEHVANPVAAFREWCRVLKDQGIIYLVVPHRALTFDRPRPLTTVDHMLQDHAVGTTQVDGTHIDDFVYGVDWSLFSPATPAGEVAAARERQAQEYRTAIAEGREINIHFHTFEPQQLNELITAVNALPDANARIEVLETIAPFSASRPDGFLLIARVHKPGAPRSVRGTPLPDRASVVRPDAQRLA